MLDRRFPNLEILISPARVQGDLAPGEITAALERLYRIDNLDLIILARGGGSKEDLWAFNDEALARKIAVSPVPVISAVGHEIDVTIADLVADMRAATPSMAAEIVVREKAELLQDIAELRAKIALALQNRIEIHAREVDQMQSDLIRLFRAKLDTTESEMAALSGKLDALSPLKVLERGYSITHKLPSMKIVKDSGELKHGDEILIHFKKGKARCSVDETED